MRAPAGAERSCDAPSRLLIQRLEAAKVLQDACNGVVRLTNAPRCRLGIGGHWKSKAQRHQARQPSLDHIAGGGH